MRKLKIYLDTSVISYLKQEDAPKNMALTIQLWEQLKNDEFVVYISEIGLAEIGECAEPKRTILMEYLAEIRYEKIYLNDEILLLADKYIEQGIIPGMYRDDALHISAATVFDCNVVVSWNFKHMVKLKTIIGVNGINKLMGYGEIEIFPPNIIIGEDDEG